MQKKYVRKFFTIKTLKLIKDFHAKPMADITLSGEWLSASLRWASTRVALLTLLPNMAVMHWELEGW